MMEWFAVGAGVLTIVAAVADWDWFMNANKAKLFVKLFGRNGARVFYVLLGLFIIGLGLMIAAGPAGQVR